MDIPARVRCPVPPALIAATLTSNDTALGDWSAGWLTLRLMALLRLPESRRRDRQPTRSSRNHCIRQFSFARRLAMGRLMRILENLPCRLQSSVAILSSEYSMGGFDQSLGSSSSIPQSLSTISLISFVSTASAVLGELELANGLLLDLRTFCNLIAAHPTLQQTEIMSTESYATAGIAYSHRFLILELCGLNGRVVYVRLDRRRTPVAAARFLLLNGGEGPANNQVRSPKHLKNCWSDHLSN